MDEKKRLEKRISNIEVKIKQTHARLQKEQASLSKTARNARTRRLIIEGATLERAVGCSLEADEIYAMYYYANAGGWQPPKQDGADE